MIPGHGGLVDRMDCQVLMAIFTYIYYESFIKYPQVQFFSSNVHCSQPFLQSDESRASAAAGERAATRPAARVLRAAYAFAAASGPLAAVAMTRRLHNTILLLSYR